MDCSPSIYFHLTGVPGYQYPAAQLTVVIRFDIIVIVLCILQVLPGYLVLK